jgi:hypothetical protein
MIAEQPKSPHGLPLTINSAAPRTMPLQPNRPSSSPGGRNAPVGLAAVTQLAGLKDHTPTVTPLPPTLPT